MLRTVNTECRPSLLSYPPLLNRCHTPPVNAGCRSRQAHAYRLARDPPRTAKETKTAQLPVLATPQQTAMEERERGTPEAGVLLGPPGLPPHHLGGKRRYPAWAADRPPWCLPRPVDWLRQRSGRCENENDTPKSPSKVGEPRPCPSQAPINRTLSQRSGILLLSAPYIVLSARASLAAFQMNPCHPERSHLYAVHVPSRWVLGLVGSQRVILRLHKLRNVNAESDKR